MPSWNAFSYTFGPLVALVGMGLFILILKWAFSRGGSLIARPVTPGDPDDYGLLVPIASPQTFIDGEIMRRTLIDNGIRANLVNTNAGPRIMVWPADEVSAKRILSRGPGASRG